MNMETLCPSLMAATEANTETTLTQGALPVVLDPLHGLFDALQQFLAKNMEDDREHIGGCLLINHRCASVLLLSLELFYMLLFMVNMVLASSLVSAIMDAAGMTWRTRPTAAPT